MIKPKPLIEVLDLICDLYGNCDHLIEVLGVVTTADCPKESKAPAEICGGFAIGDR
jgi:hypothetical protein